MEHGRDVVTLAGAFAARIEAGLAGDEFRVMAFWRIRVVLGWQTPMRKPSHAGNHTSIGHMCHVDAP